MGERTIVLRKARHWFVIPAPPENPPALGSNLITLILTVEKRDFPDGEFDAYALAKAWGWEVVEFRQAANGLSSLAEHAA